MELTSPTFFLSLTALFFLHWFSPRSLRAGWLLLGSYLLYALWDLRFIPVLIGSTLLDFSLGTLIDREQKQGRRKLLVIVSLVSNLGILALFKYANFFLGIYSNAAERIGIPAMSASLEIFIPLGVSFYTFHSISYVVDIYRRKIPACRSFLEYALYVSFFPKLISGPIERTENFLTQLRAERIFLWEDFFQALKLMLYGLFLKLCVGDRLSYVTDKVFKAYETAPTLELWIGYYAYSIQIYADFFGYTMIATGAARLFGIRLSANFLNPYLSASPQEFWRRWHITLSSWFRDYVYLPMGGNRKRVYLNLMVTMGLAGLWHGANLKFVFWGLFHGVLVCLQRLFLGDATKLAGWKRWIGIPVTFHLVSFGWLFFKAKDIHTAFGYASRMLEVPSLPPLMQAPMVAWCLILIGTWGVCLLLTKIFDLMPIGNFRERIYVGIPVRGGILGLLLFIVVLLGVANAQPFVYFYF